MCVRLLSWEAHGVAQAAGNCLLSNPFLIRRVKDFQKMCWERRADSSLDCCSGLLDDVWNLNKYGGTNSWFTFPLQWRIWFFFSFSLLCAVWFFSVYIKDETSILFFFFFFFTGKFHTFILSCSNLRFSWGFQVCLLSLFLFLNKINFWRQQCGWDLLYIFSAVPRLWSYIIVL